MDKEKANKRDNEEILGSGKRERGEGTKRSEWTGKEPKEEKTEKKSGSRK